MLSVQWVGEDHSHSAEPRASGEPRTAVTPSGTGSCLYAGHAGLLDYTGWKESILNIPLNKTYFTVINENNSGKLKSKKNIVL